MLIYNYKKEFLGIDEKDLKKFGLSSLAALKAEAEDFADLFIKKPGYIHNFKHVHWIDFISCAESTDESKALISINSKTFKCNITIETLYLVDNPESPAFIIHLNNLRTLRDDETQNLSMDSVERPTPQAKPISTPTQTPTPTVKKETPVITPTPAAVEEPYEHLEISLDDTPSAPLTDEYDITQTTVEEVASPVQPVAQDSYEDDMLDVGDISIDVDESITQEFKKEPKVEVPKPAAPAAPIVDDTPDYVSDYIYDPSIASKELGLPLDLIEEFIQDFIDQAHDFKEGLYNALESEDVETVKILSHKLKGVAANLRIEDAHEILSVINTTSDMNIVKTNLSIFYKIIAKLAGEELPSSSTPPPVEEVAVDEGEVTPEVTQAASIQESADDTPLEITLDDDDDDFTLDFKDEDTQIEPSIDTFEIEDSEVPHKIELPELADDEFESETAVEIDESFDIENAFDDINLDLDEITEDIQSDIKIDYSKTDVANEIGIDIESFNELFEDFVQESHTIFQRINEAIANSDYATSRNEALKLKGMSDNMRLHEFTNELETLIHSSDKDEIAQAVQKIEQTITKISKVGA